MTTAGEAQAAINEAKAKARNASRERRLQQYQGQTASHVAVASFDDGFDAGYQAGFQQALSSLQEALLDSIKAQRSGIMSRLM